MTTTRWRLIVDGRGDAAWNMALDEATLQRAAPDAVTTLRFFDWERPAITIGYAIDAPASLFLDECERRGVPVVRRVTGGGIVLHGSDLTYAVTFPRSAIAPGEGLIETYRTINRAFADALQRFGVESALLDEATKSGRPAGACFARPTRYDLVVGDKKLVGNAQRRRGQWLLNHGSMLLDDGYRALLPLLRDEAEAAAFAENSVTLSSLVRTLPSRDDLIGAIAESFGNALGVRVKRAAPTPEEIALARQLAAVKYARQAWNVDAAA
jgi:lipoate-protein ligase A